MPQLKNNKQEAVIRTDCSYALCMHHSHMVSKWRRDSDNEDDKKRPDKRVPETSHSAFDWSMNLLLLFSLLISSTSAFQCLQGIGELSKLVECSSFCYSVHYSWFSLLIIIISRNSVLQISRLPFSNVVALVKWQYTTN